MREDLVTKQSVVYRWSSGDKKAKMEALVPQTCEPSILSKVKILWTTKRSSSERLLKGF